MRPVYIVVKGGLGNQMFQAAFGTALHRRFGVEARYLTQSYQEDGFGRRLLLPGFPGLALPLAGRDEADELPVVPERGLTLQRIDELMAEHRPVVFEGYWQNERFFLGEHEAIRQAFRWTPDPQVGERAAYLRNQGAIGMHVRRHDYGQMGLAKVAYYKAAIAQIRAERGPRLLAIFTDEPNFCYHSFADVEDTTVLRGDLADPLDDLHLLSQCAHFVIANSSFSWWAAWLSAAADPIVYAPSPWLQIDDTDPIPPRWRRVEGATQAQ